MEKKYTPKTDNFFSPTTRNLNSGPSTWWGRDDDSGLRHVPCPCEQTSGKADRRDEVLDFIRDALLVVLGIFVAIKILFFIGVAIGHLVKWAAFLLF